MSLVVEEPVPPPQEAIAAPRTGHAPLRGRPPRPPRPPRRPPSAPRPPISVRDAIVRGVLLLIASLIVMFVLSILVFGHISYRAAQQQLEDRFTAELGEGTAPVSEGDFEDTLLVDGDPVAIISVPSIGLYDVVVEGTSSGVLMKGPGHRRDSVLPGQVGVSVIMGRALAFGGPFGGISSLAPGERFSVITGQGEQTFEVMGTRYAGDPAPSALASGESRLILMTARGGPLAPVGVEYVDAKLVGKAQAQGARQTTGVSLPAEDRPLATDTRTVWALIFALQFLVAAEVGAVWSLRRFGWPKTWIVFVPLLLLASLITSAQVAVLLPNLI